jgi:hypothetical protein
MTPSNSGEKILFVSHTKKRCGVHEFGLSVAEALKKSKRYSLVYVECSSPEEFITTVAGVNPAAIIYNYYASTMPWLEKSLTAKFVVPHIGIMHECTQAAADAADTSLFDYHIAPDPTLMATNPIVFKTGRVVPPYENRFSLPAITTIGSMGFATHGKGFERLMVAVQEEFDQAIIRLHIPVGDFADSSVKDLVARCQALVRKDGIKLITSHEFLEKDQLLDFLAQNTLNAFFYDKCEGRGISSAIENALAVKRPLALTRSHMFRHVLSGNPFLAEPPICIEPASGPHVSYKRKVYIRLKRLQYFATSKQWLPLHWFLSPQTSLRDIIANSIEPLVPFYREWSEANLAMDYERILDRILGKLPERSTIPYDVVQANGFLKIGIPSVDAFNRILDNDARAKYQPAIDQLFKLAPDLMVRKIPEANVQQAFVMDTVQKFASRFESPKILCVGSFEDTAAVSLKKMGYKIEEIDPVLDRSLAEFFHQPSTARGGYDIIFSTSVLEHVQNDELFMTQIAQLLAPGGVGILTCDYNDQYKPGDPLPREDFRFYTQKDLKQRIVPLLQDCSLIDEPQWDCPDPDFTYQNYYRYTFASLVFERNKMEGNHGVC